MEMHAQFACVFAAAYLLQEGEATKKLKRKRSEWVSNWIKKRPYEGCYANLLRELKNEQPKMYRNFLRMSFNDFDFLLNLVSPKIAKKDTQMRKAISAGERLALTLRFLATGDSFKSLSYLFRIPQCTISKIVPEVLDAIYVVLKDDYMKFPSTELEWCGIAEKFDELCNFPNCIGAVDGKHVVMNAPPNSGSIFYNYKHTHSIILMGICDAQYKLLYIDVGCNGRLSDGGVFNKCSFANALSTGGLNLPNPKPLEGREVPLPFMLVADDAFALKPNVMKPYSGKELTGLQRIFNYRTSRARCKIENVFGIISARFRVFRKPINLDADKTRKLTLACCALHNFLITRNSALYAPSGTFDSFSQEGSITPGHWRQENSEPNFIPLEGEGTRYTSNNAKEIRDELAQYFVQEGEIPWQYKHI